MGTDEEGRLNLLALHMAAPALLTAGKGSDVGPPLSSLLCRCALGDRHAVGSSSDPRTQADGEQDGRIAGKGLDQLSAREAITKGRLRGAAG